jgi:iron complex outermembrane receptor protein
MKKNFTFALAFFTFALFCLCASSAHAQERETEPDTLLNSLLDMQIEDLMKIVIVSASQQHETLDEVPVPVTVITDEMIRNSGAKNLRDLMMLFVPNMTLSQDHNEMNIAMRGVYASSQQKILMMLNGHRMNSRSYSEANPNYSISLEKIKRIEILRGPASSLYGNVALTAVVNIITKSGEDISGIQTEVGFGNFGQRKASMLFGEKFSEKRDLTVWANFYQADGQKIAVAKENDYSANPKDGFAVVDANRDKPSYDVGFNMQSGKLSLMGNLRYGKMTEPFSGGGPTGEVYNLEDYRKINGVSPGLGTAFAHFDAKYDTKIGEKWTLNVNPYFDHSVIDGIIVINPANKQFANIAWREYSTGFIAQLTKSYESPIGKGSLLFGTQTDHMYVYDSHFLMGMNGQWANMVDRDTAKLLTTGGETIYSGFFQVKHYFSEKLIANLGMRYDEKDRFRGENIRNLSPRLALIYLPNENMNFKISYSTSFVDAPYWYRYNSLASYKGSANLLPERLSSLQFTPTFRLFNGKVFYNINFFYNRLTDFIYRVPNAQGEEPRYRNAGELTSWGLEHEVAFLHKFIKIRAVAGQQYAIAAKDYPSSGKDIGNVPSFSFALNADYTPFAKFSAFKINANIRHYGSQYAPIFRTMLNGAPFEDLNNRISAYTVASFGFRLDDWKGFTLDGRVFNAGDVRYYAGGSVNFPYPQAGRWFLMTIGYKIPSSKLR